METGRRVGGAGWWTGCLGAASFYRVGPMNVHECTRAALPCAASSRALILQQGYVAGHPGTPSCGHGTRRRGMRNFASTVLCQHGPTCVPTKLSILAKLSTRPLARACYGVPYEQSTSASCIGAAVLERGRTRRRAPRLSAPPHQQSAAAAAAGV